MPLKTSENVANLRRKILKYLSILIVAYGAYHYIIALYEFVSTTTTNRKYQRNLLHLKARVITVAARKEYMDTQEGARKVLDQRLKELGN